MTPLPLPTSLVFKSVEGNLTLKHSGHRGASLILALCLEVE